MPSGCLDASRTLPGPYPCSRPLRAGALRSSGRAHRPSCQSGYPKLVTFRCSWAGRRPARQSQGAHRCAADRATPAGGRGVVTRTCAAPALPTLTCSARPEADCTRAFVRPTGHAHPETTGRTTGRPAARCPASLARAPPRRPAARAIHVCGSSPRHRGVVLVPDPWRKVRLGGRPAAGDRAVPPSSASHCFDGCRPPTCRGRTSGSPLSI